jgi:AraC-like DNA-binding protein
MGKKQTSDNIDIYSLVGPQGFGGVESSVAGMCLCVSGEADILLGKKVFKMREGMLRVMSPVIFGYFISKSKDYEELQVVDSIDVFYPILHDNVDTLVQLKVMDSPFLELNDDEIRVFKACKKRIEFRKTSLEAEIDSAEKVLIQKIIHTIEQGLFLEVIDAFYKSSSVKSRPLTHEYTLIYNFAYEVHKHYKEHRDVAFYASEAGLSQGYFSTLVKRVIGISPSEVISMITIMQAEYLLESTHKSIKEIAAELKFPEQFTFRKYFKQHTGIPPKEYRRRALQAASDKIKGSEQEGQDRD